MAVIVLFALILICCFSQLCSKAQKEKTVNRLADEYIALQASLEKTGAKEGTEIHIDINGSGNGPNIYGQDIFVFVVNKDSELLPAGYNMADERLRDKNYPQSCPKKYYMADGKGIVCAARIIRDGWKIMYW